VDGGTRIRRAEPRDLDFIVELATHDEVEPFLSTRRPRGPEEVLEEVERSLREPLVFGRFVVEVDGRRAGIMGFHVENRRSRIAALGGLAVHPDFRGRGVADAAARELQRHLIGELGYHRLQLEIYGFNERAIAHAERAGFVREGVRRRAYWRHGEWVDGILFGLVREDVEMPVSGIEVLRDHVVRFNDGVRTGDFAAMLERFADDGRMAFDGVPVGPFESREAIAAAYRVQPPDDEIELLEVAERGRELAVARYAWAAEPEVAAGELRLRREGDRISELVVTFDRGVTWS
jgi:RimJ/RimL family protein N-acetyltransferase